MLELGNGALAVLSICFMVFVLVYLIRQSRLEHVRASMWFCRLPEGMRVAISLFTISLATFITRVDVWVWRTYYGGKDPFSRVQIGFFMLGVSLACVGYIWAIREYSKPLYGDWPWLASCVAAALFMLGTFVTR